jgi:hypothetical protein
VWAVWECGYGILVVVVENELVEMSIAGVLWVYEVTACFNNSIKDEFSSDLPGFHPITTWHEDDNTSDNSTTWVIRYFADSREAIRDYFEGVAPELRAETAKFGDLVQVSRRILKPL